MPYVNASEIRLDRRDNLLIVRSPFWTVTHDLARGGAVVDIRFAHGREGNILRSPMATFVDGLSDLACPDAKATHRRRPDGVELVVEGALADKNGKASSARFKTTYIYTPYSIRREIALRLPAGTKAKTVSPLCLSLDDRFTHYSAGLDPHSQSVSYESGLGPCWTGAIQPIPSRGAFFRDSWPPGWVTFHRPGGEAIQIVPSGDLSVWDAPAAKGGHNSSDVARRPSLAAASGGDGQGWPPPIIEGGQGRFTLARARGGFKVEMSSLHVAKAAALPGELVFAASIGLVNLPSAHPATMRMSMIGNPPFPSDALLKAWKRSGTEVLVIMEGVRWNGRREDSPGGDGYWRSGTDRYWRMGGYPPYSAPADMRDLARLVKSAHRLGMKVVPYTAPAEIHPEVGVFNKSIQEWRQQVVPDGGTVFHSTGCYPGAVWGALVCPDSKGMQDFYLDFVKKYVRNHNFDGIYVDLASKVNCYNTLHGPAHHGGIDGLWDVLGKAREFLGPDKIIVGHNGNSNMMVTLSNLCDAVVTMEMFNGPKVWNWDLDIVHSYIRAFPACPVLMIPDYRWFWTTTKRARAGRALEDGIAKSVLLGSALFHLDVYFDPWKWGYRDGAASVRDPRSLWAMFHRLKAMNLEGMQFDDYQTKVVRTNRPGVLGARYHDSKRQVIVLANISNKPQRNIRWQCDGASGQVPMLEAKGYTFIEPRL
jgi:hypothetical protein